MRTSSREGVAAAVRESVRDVAQHCLHTRCSTRDSCSDPSGKLDATDRTLFS
jgi:hypothetical protein